MANKFSKGEVGVLLNDNGGRLFKVFRCRGGVVKEQATFRSQQTYSLEVPESNVVKCRNQASATALVERLRELQNRYLHEVAEAKHRRTLDWRAAIIAHLESEADG